MIQHTAQQLPFFRDNGQERTVALDELHTIFIQNVSHELRTPLSLLQGYAELLHEGELGPLSSEQQQALTIIVERTRELRTLVERIGILLATRAHATVSVPISLAELVAQLIQGRCGAASEAGLALEVHVDPNLPLISGDPYQLQPALDCLLENAIKFTPRGGRVEVRVYTAPGWVCLAVTDTGVGLPGEELARIFSPFYQIDGSTTRRYGGLGLGLGIVNAVVNGHGGHVEVASRPDQGSCFIVKLPAMPTPVFGEQARTDRAAPRRILVVDDEENVALTIQDGLERLPNCEIIVATSGAVALQLFEAAPFDLLITDYKMPGTDGMTLSARVRQLYPQTSIVMITAYSSQLLRQQATAIAIRYVLDKPVKLDEIRSVALEALESQPSAPGS
jgi:CheY-like chemotaxis protein